MATVKPVQSSMAESIDIWKKIVAAVSKNLLTSKSRKCSRKQKSSARFVRMAYFLTDDVSSLFVIEKLSPQTIVAYVSLTADTVALKPTERKKAGLKRFRFCFYWL